VNDLASRISRDFLVPLAPPKPATQTQSGESQTQTQSGESQTQTAGVAVR